MTPASVQRVLYGSPAERLGSKYKELKVPAQTAVLIRERVANLNACLVCMDTTRWYATQHALESAARFDALADYRMSPPFTDAGRAALGYPTELTSKKEMDPGT